MLWHACESYHLRGLYPAQIRRFVDASIRDGEWRYCRHSPYFFVFVGCIVSVMRLVAAGLFVFVAWVGGVSLSVSGVGIWGQELVVAGLAVAFCRVVARKC